MKETKITKENIKIYSVMRGEEMRNRYFWQCQKHKQTCERLLEFLVEIINHPELYSLRNNFKSIVIKKMHEEIKDKEQAIKLYDEAGI